MSAAATLAAAEAALQAAKIAIVEAKKVIKGARIALAKQEMVDAKDYDGNGRIGSVGGRKRVQRRARG